jgi:hypothetical protein
MWRSEQQQSRRDWIQLYFTAENHQINHWIAFFSVLASVNSKIWLLASIIYRDLKQVPVELRCWLRLYVPDVLLFSFVFQVASSRYTLHWLMIYRDVYVSVSSFLLHSPHPIIM